MSDLHTLIIVTGGLWDEDDEWAQENGLPSLAQFDLPEIPPNLTLSKLTEILERILPDAEYDFVTAEEESNAVDIDIYLGDSTTSIYLDDPIHPTVDGYFPEIVDPLLNALSETFGHLILVDSNGQVVFHTFPT